MQTLLGIARKVRRLSDITREAAWFGIAKVYLPRLLAEMSSARTRRPLPGLGLALALAPGSSFKREVESRNGSVAGADAEWLSGASVFETWSAKTLLTVVTTVTVVRRCT